MAGSEIYKHAVTNLALCSKKVIEMSDIQVDDINWLVPHQANIRIIQTTADRCKVPMEKVIITLDKFGNTSAASIPMAIVDGQDKFKKGDLLLCPAFGGGLTSGATLIRW